MSRHYLDLALTPSVRAQQTHRAACAAAHDAPRERDADVLSPREIGFIEARDSFYLATVSETGWPYVQHRGGPPGFVRHLDETSFGWAEYAGNHQYISLGNTAANDRVALIFVDYPNRRRLKVWGRLHAYGPDARPDLTLQLDEGREDARAERFMLITVEAFDWNCPRHITPRFSAAEVNKIVAPLRARIAELEARPLPTDATPTREPAPSGRSRALMLGAGGLAATAGLTHASSAQTVPVGRTVRKPAAKEPAP